MTTRPAEKLLGVYQQTKPKVHTMKITVTESMFKDQFKAYGREDNFSNAGLSALFEHLTESEQDVGEEMELDVIALCCEFTESSVTEIIGDYGFDFPDCVEMEDQFNAVLEYLENETVVVYSDEDTGMILYQNF